MSAGEVKDKLADVEHALNERRLAREFLAAARDRLKEAKAQVDIREDTVAAAERRLEAADNAAQRAIDAAARK